MNPYITNINIFDEHNTYKYIWNNIPMFSLVIGKNGCGKTLLMDYILATYENTNINIVLYKYNTQNASTYKNKIINQVREWFNISDIINVLCYNNNNNFDINFRTFLIDNKKYCLKHNNISDITKKYLKYAGIKYNGFVDVPGYFKDYSNNDECIKINKYIKENNVFKFKYTIKLIGFNDIRFGNNPQLTYSQLSSGEQTIFKLILWLYSNIGYKNNDTKKVLLLDEPDSFIDIYTINEFILILNNISIKQNCQIIMTTHRIDTMYNALRYDCKIYYMDNKKLKLYNIDKINNIMKSQLNIIPKFFNNIYVEGSDDKKFYEYIYKQLTKDNNTYFKLITHEFYNNNILYNNLITLINNSDNPNNEDEKYIDNKLNTILIKKIKGSNIIKLYSKLNSNQISTIQIKRTIGYNDGGGKHEMIKYINNYTYMILDRDSENNNSYKLKNNCKYKENIQITNRYSLESYLLDPIIQYQIKNNTNDENFIKNINIKISDDFGKIPYYPCVYIHINTKKEYIIQIPLFYSTCKFKGIHNNCQKCKSYYIPPKNKTDVMNKIINKYNKKAVLNFMEKIKIIPKVLYTMLLYIKL